MRPGIEHALLDLDHPVVLLRWTELLPALLAPHHDGLLYIGGHANLSLRGLDLN